MLKRFSIKKRVIIAITFMIFLVTSILLYIALNNVTTVIHQAEKKNCNAFLTSPKLSLIVRENWLSDWQLWSL